MGDFMGKRIPQRRTAKVKAWWEEGVPDRLKEGKESLGRWTSVREEKGRTRQSWTHRTSKPIFMFLVFLLRAVRRR